ncbi:uncharacterized protein LOC132628572 [Lycium barbarum]|uniref:uncharacterized protein LOC132628572 n=1 Tax=Lycium barbarum TaxID=112863 RepID=UPI00293EEDEF|nr:uncharacterized protein LOC132628572 [Lycium barbarum]
MSVDTPFVELVPVVNGFAEVFPTDLSGMPLDCDIDFFIDFEPGTRPISIPPYHMAPKELSELKEQLQALLSKRFIRSSVSRWGSPALIVNKNYGSMRMCIEFWQLNKATIRNKDIIPRIGDLFDQLQASILALHVNGKDFNIYCDASQIGLDYVLMQEGKANVVVDVLSQKAVNMGSLARVIVRKHHLAMEVQSLANSMVRLDISEPSKVLTCVKARSSLLEQIKAQLFEDAKLCKIWDKVLSGEATETILDDEGLLRIKGRICVPRVGGLIKLILKEAHSSRYSIHPSAIKMYRDLGHHYCWGRMKKDKVDFVSQCLNCQ